MAGVGGGGGGKRNVNSDVNMIPFIDLLMVTISFLLITAVWVTFSRMNANAQVPGPPSNTEVEPTTPEKVLHLHILENEFSLVWKQGATVVSETRVPKPAAKEVLAYPDLGKKLGEEWKTHGGHQDPGDKKVDQAVLHADNRLPFKEVIAVLDALYAQKRPVLMKGGKRAKVPVFNMTFSVR